MAPKWHAVVSSAVPSPAQLASYVPLSSFLLGGRARAAITSLHLAGASSAESSPAQQLRLPSIRHPCTTALTLRCFDRDAVPSFAQQKALLALLPLRARAPFATRRVARARGLLALFARPLSTFSLLFSPPPLRGCTDVCPQSLARKCLCAHASAPEAPAPSADRPPRRRRGALQRRRSRLSTGSAASALEARPVVVAVAVLVVEWSATCPPACRCRARALVGG